MLSSCNSILPQNCYLFQVLTPYYLTILTDNPAILSRKYGKSKINLIKLIRIIIFDQVLAFLILLYLSDYADKIEYSNSPQY